MTKDKVLWIYLLRRLVREKTIPLPPYVKAVNALSGDQLEALTRRVALLAHKWNLGLVKPQAIVRLDLPRSVTWLRLVTGRWLFVASYDARASSFACWDIAAAFQGAKEPVAECFFSGPVHSAVFEIQHEGIVMALSVESRCASVLPLNRLIALING